jgi:hypothetical protein
MKGNTINPAHEEASAVDAPGQGCVRCASSRLRSAYSSRGFLIAQSHCPQTQQSRVAPTYLLRVYAADCTASVLRCAVNVWRLASSV